MFQYYSYITTYISIFSHNDTKLNRYIWYLIVHYEIYIIFYKYFVEIFTIHRIYSYFTAINPPIG